MFKVIWKIHNLFNEDSLFSYNPEEHEEVCPECNSNLFSQGFERSMPYWVCRECGEFLIDADNDDCL